MHAGEQLVHDLHGGADAGLGVGAPDFRRDGGKHRVAWTGEETVWLAVHLAQRWTPGRE